MGTCARHIKAVLFIINTVGLNVGITTRSRHYGAVHSGTCSARHAPRTGHQNQINSTSYKVDYISCYRETVVIKLNTCSCAIWTAVTDLALGPQTYSAFVFLRSFFFFLFLVACASID